jgi:hypothetical protein
VISSVAGEMVEAVPARGDVGGAECCFRSGGSVLKCSAVKMGVLRFGRAYIWGLCQDKVLFTTRQDACL